MNENAVFRAKLTGPGIDVDREVDQKTAFALVAVLIGGDSVIGVPQLRPPLPDDRTHASNRPRISLREFLAESYAETSKEKITAIAHYVCTIEGQVSFSLDDIRNGYRTAREILPKNITRDFGNVCKAGWAHPSGDAGKYYVTNTGQAQVESKFGKK